MAYRFHFVELFKNLAMIGGLIMIWMNGAGTYSIDGWLLRRELAGASRERTSMRGQRGNAESRNTMPVPLRRITGH